MRKIEENMLNAIWNKLTVNLSNTSVHYNEHTQMSLVRLHGNLIATYKHDGLYKYKEWATTTTRSRLRAMGINASIKGGKAVIDGVVL